jgi:hypothetical protein
MDSKDTVLSYYTYKKVGARKDVLFYGSVVSLYKENPECGKEVINLLVKIGYYKDYFHILEASDSEELNDYIYSELIFLIEGWKENHNLILAKWIPREKSSFDRKLNFVKNISKMLFPNGIISTQKKKYRQLVSEASAKLNTIESNLCKRTYDKITKFTDNNLKSYQKAINKNKDLRVRVEDYLNKKYSSKSLPRLLDEYDSKVITDIKQPLLKEHIDKCINNIKKYNDNTLMILDITSYLFNISKNTLYSHMLIYLANHNKIIINAQVPILLTVNEDATMEKKIETINENISSYRTVDIDYIKTMTQNKYSNYVIITSNTQIKNITDTEVICIEEISNKISRTSSDKNRLKKVIEKYTTTCVGWCVGWWYIALCCVCILLLICYIKEYKAE